MAPHCHYCERPPKAKGLCPAHYKRAQRALAVSSPATRAEPLDPSLSPLRRAARNLAKLTPEFVSLLYTAAKNAAQKGDAGPSQWALLHSRAVQPLATQGVTASGVTINLGVKVSGTDTAIGAQAKVTQ